MSTLKLLLIKNNIANLLTRKQMKKFLFWAFISACFISCSDDEKVVPLLDIPSTLNDTSAKKVFAFDGMTTEVSTVTFEMLSSVNPNNGDVYEAEMEMTLPVSIRTSTTSNTFNPFKFKVKAVSNEEYITFSGDCLYEIGEVKLSAEGIYQKNTGWDSLRINLKREVPQVAFADNTYELALNEETFDLTDIGDNDNELEWNEPLPLIEYAEEGMSKYMSYLKDKTQDAVYQFTFQTDGNLVIKKRNSQMQDFETLSGRFKYYLADQEIGFMELEKEYATEVIRLLTANPDATPEGFFHTTYLFEDILDIPFCYKDRGETLWLAIGDKTGFTNMNQILFHWRTLADDYYNMDEADPLSFVYMEWNKRENYSDQLWWRLEKR